jgi:hypothetical protein
MSNKYQLGWWTDVDHRFNISKYGQIRPEKAFAKNWNTIRMVQPDQMITTSYEGHPINRDVAMFMINFTHRKKMLHDNAQNILFGKGIANVNSARKMTKEDISHLIAQSNSKNAHAKYEDTTIDRPALVPHADLEVGSKVVINQQIVDFISDVLLKRKNPDMKIGDMRDAILQTATDNGIYQTLSNKSSGQLPDQHQNRETNDSQSFGNIYDGKTVKSYAGLHPPVLSDSHGNANYEAYKSRSKEAENYEASQQTHKKKTTDDFSGENIISEMEGLTKNRVSRSVGKKYLRDEIKYEGDNGESMRDIEAHTR